MCYQNWQQQDLNKLSIMLDARRVKTNLVHFTVKAKAGGVVYWYLETLSTPKMFLDSRHCRYMSFLYCGHIRYLTRPATNESVGPVVSCYVWAPYEKK